MPDIRILPPSRNYCRQTLSCAPELDYNLILAKDSVCYRHLLKRLLENRHHVLCVGDTGTAKSVTIQRLLKSGMSSNFDAVFTGLSAQTGCNMVQDIIDDKFDKRRPATGGLKWGA